MDRGIYAQGLTEVSLTRRDPLGSLRVENGKMYKYVQIKNTTATVAGAAGDPVAYGASGLASHLCVIDLTDADAEPICAGLLVASVAGVHSPATTYYAWVQVTGPATYVEAASGSPGEGDVLALSTTDKTLKKRAAADEGIVGQVNDVTGKSILLQCPF